MRVSYDYALNNPGEKIPEFAKYLISLGFPLPTLGAYLATYTEFIGGILLILGLWTRFAAIALIINFSLAFVFAHLVINDTYQNTFPSANLLAVSVFLFLNGPGKYAIIPEK